MPHATPSPVTDRTVDAEVTYTCEADYFFDHTTNDDTATVTCLPTGDWSQLQEQCTSRNHVVYCKPIGLHTMNMSCTVHMYTYMYV